MISRNRNYHYLAAALALAGALIGPGPALAATIGPPVNPISAPAGNGAITGIDQTINSGLLTLSTSDTAAMTAVNADITQFQDSSGSFGPVEAIDSRGSNAGWSVTATASSFTKVDAPVRTGGSGPADITVGGTSAAMTNQTYTVSIVQDGRPGTAAFVLSGDANSGPTAVETFDQSLGVDGLTIHFDDGDYHVGDSWQVTTEVIPASNLTLLPNPINTLTGSATGVQAGGEYSFSGSSDSATIMAADPGSGAGWYRDVPNLSLEVPPTATAGDYLATLTQTIN